MIVQHRQRLHSGNLPEPWVDLPWSIVWRTSERPPSEPMRARREQILRAARTAIACKGAESVRLVDVAEAARVSIGTLQHYFGSRDALVVDAYRLQAADALEAATALAAETVDPWEGLVAVFRYLAETEGNDAASWIELSATAVRVATLQRIVDEVNAAWAHLIESLIDRGVAQRTFRPALSRADLLEAILSLVDGMELAISTRRANPDIVANRLLAATAVLVGRTAL
jgi:AcrR family transcriptional regulator